MGAGAECPWWVCEQAAEISAESETSAKSLERRGCVIANLKCTDAQVWCLPTSMNIVFGCKSFVGLYLTVLIPRVDRTYGKDSPGVPA